MLKTQTAADAKAENNRIFIKTLLYGFRFAIIFLSLASCPIYSEEKFKREDTIQQKLSEIPREDRECLERFFRFVIFRSSFGYVLFGDKPMAFEDFLDLEEISHEYLRFYTSLERGIEFYILRKGIESWEKHQHLFPLKRNLLIVNKAKKNGQGITVFLINKERFAQIFEKCRDDFEVVTGKELKAEELLNCLGKGSRSFRKKLRSHPALFGILLGYGRNNAWLYHQWIESKKHKKSKQPTTDAFPTLFNGVPNSDIDLPIPLPTFFCDPSSLETKELKQRYEKQRQIIYQSYQNGDFLERTLEALMR